MVSVSYHRRATLLGPVAVRAAAHHAHCPGGLRRSGRARTGFYLFAAAACLPDLRMLKGQKLEETRRRNQQIRRLRRQGVKLRELAQRFGLPISTINSAIRGYHRKHDD